MRGFTRIQRTVYVNERFVCVCGGGGGIHEQLNRKKGGGAVF